MEVVWKGTLPRVDRHGKEWGGSMSAIRMTTDEVVEFDVPATGIHRTTEFPKLQEAGIKTKWFCVNPKLATEE